jgi:hypothetical protein
LTPFFSPEGGGEIVGISDDKSLFLSRDVRQQISVPKINNSLNGGTVW